LSIVMDALSSPAGEVVRAGNPETLFWKEQRGLATLHALRALGAISMDDSVPAIPA